MFFHLKIMLRNLQRGGVYSVINIGGLAIGMAAAILILAWIYHEWSYDRFMQRKNACIRFIIVLQWMAAWNVGVLRPRFWVQP